MEMLQLRSENFMSTICTGMFRILPTEKVFYHLYRDVQNTFNRESVLPFVQGCSEYFQQRKCSTICTGMSRIFLTAENVFFVCVWNIL